jgi:YebC/PmpR family DNA-binding regulatory protein
MAGHSQFANIKHRKGAQDKKRAKLFTKIIREIQTAASIGLPDQDANPRLRTAIAYARTQNVPKDRIDAAIKKSTSSDESENFMEIRYEGYAPGGIALIVETLTDNKNRTASDVRSAFTKYGGALGETNSVSFMFDRVGVIQYPVSKATIEQMLEAAIEGGAEDCESDELFHTIYCAVDNFYSVKEYLISKFGEPESMRLAWKPHNLVEIVDKEQAEKLLKLLDLLEDSDDVQYVEGNYHIANAILEELEK